MTNINTSAFRANEDVYIMLRDLQFIGHFTYQVFPFFNLISIPVIIIAHVSHLGSPHCITVLEVLTETNLACVSSFFRFFGWRRLTINFVFSSIGLIFLIFLGIASSVLSCGLFVGGWDCVLKLVEGSLCCYFCSLVPEVLPVREMWLFPLLS